MHNNDIATFLNISQREVQYQVKRCRLGLYVDAQRGRRTKFDNTAKETICANLTKCRNEQNSVTYGQFRDMVTQAANETEARREIYSHSTELSRSTIYNLVEECDFRRVKGQTTTKARQLAQQDIRNYVSVAIMHCAMGDGLKPHQIYNFDSTTYGVLGDNTTVVYQFNPDDDSPVTRVKENELELSIKTYFCHNGAGNMAPLVIVVVDESLEGDSIVPVKVGGISGSGVSGIGEEGWIVFSRTRGGGDNFFCWYMEFVVIQFILNMRACYADVDNNEEAKAYIHIDGEIQQIKSYLKPEMQQLFASNSIMVGKLPASCSGTMQASDEENFSNLARST